MDKKMDGIVPITELQTRSRELVHQVQQTGEPIVITQRGRPAAMLVNYDLYEGHLATIDETSHSDWVRRLSRAQRELAHGRLAPHDGVVRRRKRGHR